MIHVEIRKIKKDFPGNVQMVADQEIGIFCTTPEHSSDHKTLAIGKESCRFPKHLPHCLSLAQTAHALYFPTLRLSLDNLSLNHPWIDSQLSTPQPHIPTPLHLVAPPPIRNHGVGKLGTVVSKYSQLRQSTSFRMTLLCTPEKLRL